MSEWKRQPKGKQVGHGTSLPDSVQAGREVRTGADVRGPAMRGACGPEPTPALAALTTENSERADHERVDELKALVREIAWRDPERVIQCGGSDVDAFLSGRGGRVVLIGTVGENVSVMLSDRRAGLYKVYEASRGSLGHAGLIVRRFLRGVGDGA